ncbi:MAG: hypothetical protein JXQ67_07020 [Campylobacterales bacterium]|nr:hypothetical protein [Campylobacterales bacterium]
MSSVGVIGAGNVGVGVVDALAMLGIAKEIYLYNRTKSLAEAQAWDINDAVPLLNGNTNVTPTDDLEDLRGCEIIAITSGAKQEAGESRLALVKKNTTIIIELMQKLDVINPDAIIIIVTNPVDIMTRIAREYSTREAKKLFGSGTVLDTLRLREELGLRLNINRKNIHAFIVGEHGDSEFALWSVATIGPVLLENFGIDKLETMKVEILQKVRERAYRIIERKGYTKQAIGVAVAKLIKSILQDEKRIFTLSTKLSEKCRKVQSDVVLSQPCVLGKEGIEKVLILECNIAEYDSLKNSIEVLDKTYKSIKKES